MDFKTKRKIVIMKRKFDHNDAVMLSGVLTIITAIVVMIITSGFTV